MRIVRWLRRFWDKHGPARRISVVEGDTLPGGLPKRDLILLRDDGEDWSVGFRCPCGCGETIELAVMVLYHGSPGGSRAGGGLAGAFGFPFFRDVLWGEKRLT